MEKELYKMLKKVLQTAYEHEECKSYEWWVVSGKADKLVKKYEKKES